MQKEIFVYFCSQQLIVSCATSTAVAVAQPPFLEKTSKKRPH
jgi:hypothetical protein